MATKEPRIAEEQIVIDGRLLRKILVYEHVRPGTVVDTGYSGETSRAPREKGKHDMRYSFYQLADENNCHVGWVWSEE